MTLISFRSRRDLISATSSVGLTVRSFVAFGKVDHARHGASHQASGFSQATPRRRAIDVGQWRWPRESRIIYRTSGQK